MRKRRFRKSRIVATCASVGAATVLATAMALGNTASANPTNASGSSRSTGSTVARQATSDTNDNSGATPYSGNSSTAIANTSSGGS